VLLVCNANGSDKLHQMYLANILVHVALRMLKKLLTKYANTNSWISMINWGLKIKKILLFIDQCAACLNITFLRNIKDVFLPGNCTSQLPPLDLAVIHSFKYTFMVSIFIHKTFVMTDGRLLQDASCMKQHVLSVMNFTTGPLKLIMQTSIQNCVIKCGFPVNHF
jgi:hypothetical protein